MSKPTEEFTPATHEREQGWLWEGPAETLIRRGDQHISPDDMKIAWADLQNSGQLVKMPADRFRSFRSPSDYDRGQAQAVGRWFIRSEFHHYGRTAAPDGEWLIVAEQCDGQERTKYWPRGAGEPLPADAELAAENERLQAENIRLKDGLREIARLVQELL